MAPVTLHSLAGLSTLFLTKRDDSKNEDEKDNDFHPGQGAINPNSINMKALMVLFALIGAGFALAGIWFFFWAKNGGFVWKKNDWEEYKSTVLRRKGPDGRTLSNATKSTKLGGGSIVGFSDEGMTITDMTETATTFSEKRPRRKRNLRELLLRRQREEEWEGAEDEDVRRYRDEKPARVGGINSEPEGTYYGTEYTTSNPPTSYNESEVQSQSYHSEGRRNRTVSEWSFKAGSEDVLSRATDERQLIRGTEHSHSRRGSRRESRHGHESRRHHRQSRHSHSRHSSPRKRDRSSVGNYTEPLDFSSRASNTDYQYSSISTELDDGKGTKTYHHPIPELTRGYRREYNGRRSRRDSLSESDSDS